MCSFQKKKKNKKNANLLPSQNQLVKQLMSPIFKQFSAAMRAWNFCFYMEVETPYSTARVQKLTLEEKCQIQQQSQIKKDMSSDHRDWLFITEMYWSAKICLYYSLFWWWEHLSENDKLYLWLPAVSFGAIIKKNAFRIIYHLYLEKKHWVYESV